MIFNRYCQAFYTCKSLARQSVGVKIQIASQVLFVTREIWLILDDAPNMMSKYGLQSRQNWLAIRFQIIMRVTVASGLQTGITVVPGQFKDLKWSLWCLIFSNFWAQAREVTVLLAWDSSWFVAHRASDSTKCWNSSPHGTVYGSPLGQAARWQASKWWLGCTVGSS